MIFGEGIVLQDAFIIEGNMSWHNSMVYCVVRYDIAGAFDSGGCSMTERAALFHPTLYKKFMPNYQKKGLQMEAPFIQL